MALAESGGPQVAPITYGGRRKKAKKVAKGSPTIRGGRKQSLFVSPRGRRR